MASTAGIRQIRVFIASPGDVAVERRAFKDVLDELNKGYGRGAHVEFVPLGWEDTLSTVGRRAQSVINQEVDACDVFVLVMWRRWGQPAPDAAPYSSYTEEEFYRALARFEKTNKTPCIWVFLKHIDPGQMADAGPQLAKVLEFRKKLEETRKVLYRGFADEAAFREEVDNHLVAFADGRCDACAPADAVPIIPDAIQKQLDDALSEITKLKADNKSALKEAEKARAEAKSATDRLAATERIRESKSESEMLTLAEKAAKAALDGHIEAARQDFAKALDGTTNLQILYLGYDFFNRIGDLDEAERLLQRWLAISGRDKQSPDTAAALGNLGLIARKRGNLDEAEKLHRESLEIHRKLGRLGGQASGLGNLGLIAKTRGDLDAAGKFLRESLEIDRKLGRLEGQASQLGNLGAIALTRGDLNGAEKLLRESLEIERKLGRLEGQASALGNLGLIAQTRGDLDGAEKLHRKSLEIERKLGRLDGQASELGNLGLIAKTRGDLDAAEKLHRESLEINRKLGRLEGQANQLGNLGAIAEQRKNFAEARRLWMESRDLYMKVGIPHMMKQLQGWLDELPPQ